MNRCSLQVSKKPIKTLPIAASCSFQFFIRYFHSQINKVEDKIKKVFSLGIAIPRFSSIAMPRFQF